MHRVMAVAEDAKCVGHIMDMDTSNHKVLFQTQSTFVHRISLWGVLRQVKGVPLPPCIFSR